MPAPATHGIKGWLLLPGAGLIVVMLSCAESLFKWLQLLPKVFGSAYFGAYAFEVLLVLGLLNPKNQDHTSTTDRQHQPTDKRIEFLHWKKQTPAPPLIVFFKGMAAGFSFLFLPGSHTSGMFPAFASWAGRNRL